MTHGHHHTGGHLDHPNTELAEVLDLDARVTGRYLTDVPERMQTVLPNPARIADLGAGTGTGTLALAQRFPHAEVIAVDADVQSLERIVAVAQQAGVGHRVRTLRADLDGPFPTELDGIDAAWASSSLHHVADPDGLLRSVRSALTPGGVVAVIEIDQLPLYLPADTADGEREVRLSVIADAQGWNRFPDWSIGLSHAGFTDVTSWEIVVDTDNPPAETACLARMMFSRMRHGLADDLSNDDLHHLDRLLSTDDPSSVDRRGDLRIHSRRTAWLARHP